MNSNIHASLICMQVAKDVAVAESPPPGASFAQTHGGARGVVDLFACEIDTVCRVITVIDMVGNQKKYSFDPRKETPDGKDKAATPARFNS